MTELEEGTFRSFLAGVPEWLARLADGIFEGLPKNECAQFGTDLIDAVPVGVDLDEVKYRIAVKRNDRLLDLLGPEVEGEHPCREDVRKAIRLVSAWAGNPDRTEEARAEAYKAADEADWMADAAAYAADAAAYAAESVAYAAAEAAAARAAEAAAVTAAYATVYSEQSLSAYYATYAAVEGAEASYAAAAAAARMSAWREEANALLAELKGSEEC